MKISESNIVHRLKSRIILLIGMFFPIILCYAEQISTAYENVNNTSFWYYKNDKGSALCRNTCLLDMTITIPSFFGGLNLYRLGNGALDCSCHKAKTIIIPETVKEVSDRFIIGDCKSDMLGRYYTSTNYPSDCGLERVLFLGNCPLVDTQDIDIEFGSTFFRYLGLIIGAGLTGCNCYVVEGATGWNIGSRWQGGSVMYGATRVNVVECESTVELQCANADAKIYYTLDGSEPVAEKTNVCFEYTEPICWDRILNIKAIAHVDEYPFTIVTNHCASRGPVANVAFEPLSGEFVGTAQSVSLSCTTDGAIIYFTVDGTEPSATNGRIYNLKSA